MRSGFGWQTMGRIWQDELARWETVLGDAHPTDPPAPRWATPNERDELTTTLHLRRFGAEAGAAGTTPALVVTPQVNHSYIADFAPDQSLARTLLDRGASTVGVTDWLAPPQKNDYAIADSIDDIAAAIDRLGGRVHLVGLCQGGWQAAILACLSPERVASLTVAAAPIDTHAGATLLHAFTFGLPLSFFEWAVRVGGGNAPGRLIAQGFDTLRPFERFVYNPATLYLRAHDDAFRERRDALRNWYRLNKDVAGTLYLEAVRKLFKENQLARGALHVRGRRVDLATLRCPIHLVAGGRDHITPAAQVFALEALAPSATCQRHLVDAGHVGVFMGRKALRTVWPRVASTWS